MPASIKVDANGVIFALRDLAGDIEDKDAMLRIIGELMRTSIAYTFKEEGSPAGSWPELADSTKKKKGYTAGHKLLVMSGRLFGSFTYTISGNTLTVGTDVPYARVQQEGSRDFLGGLVGPRSRGLMAAVSAYGGHRVQKFKRYGKDQRKGVDGKWRTVRVREQGPANATSYRVGEHTRRQNIPARPFLVFRPEDPERFTQGVERYLHGATVRIGTVNANIPGDQGPR